MNKHTYMYGDFISDKVQSLNKNIHWNSSNCATLTFAPETKNLYTSNNVKEQPAINKFKMDILAYPNPTETYFNLKVKTDNRDAVELRVFDIAGKLVASMKGASQQIFRFGDQLVNGTYIVEVRQAGERKMLKIVKQ